MLNSDHVLLSRLLSSENSEIEPKLQSLRTELAEQTKLVEDARSAQSAKKPEEVTATEREELSVLAAKQAEIEGKINAELRAFGDREPLVGQLVDLALLGSGLLTGEALAAFIRRSQQLL